MQINPEYIDRFDAYLQGALSEKELETFERQLRSDAEMAEAFEAYKSVGSGIQKHYRSELKNRLLSVDREMGKPQKKSSFRTKSFWIGSSVAAAVIVGLLAVSLFNQDSHAKLAEKYWPEEEGLPVKMSEAGKFDAAMNAFKLEQWEEAAELFQRISPPSDTANYFLGVIYFNLQQYDEASRYLSTIDPATKWYHESQFRLGLVYLAAGKKARSRTILERVVASGSTFRESANAVLEEL